MVWKISSSIKQQVDRFGVIIEKVIVPNGEEKNFSYLDFAKGVCILPITKDKEIICLKQYRHAIKSWQWELPAGMIDNENDAPIETAKKELEEETGNKAEYWLDLGSFYPSPGSTSEEIYLFAATGLIATEQRLESSEQIELHKLTMEEVMTLIINGEFKHGAGLAAILRYMLMTENS
ncbi:NUDIX hydrolase [Neobacillus drentensis]|uniref:NUDIX hydrolase n=1 Tax=Neobacillus drentensis TaxID=220684 RepID=UPI0030006A6B